MAKKKRYRATITEAAVPKPRPFVPRACTVCNLAAQGVNYSRVYATRREAGRVVRYCRCDLCRNTFKQYEALGSASAPDTEDVQAQARENQGEVPEDGSDHPQKPAANLPLVDLPESRAKER